MTAGTKGYTHLEMEAALCVWECLNDYDICTKHNPDFFEGVAYDWEVIPMILDYARDPFGTPVIYKDHLPSPEQTALLVAQRHLYDEFVSFCTHEADKQWGYRELVTDDGGERMRQSFE